MNALENGKIENGPFASLEETARMQARKRESTLLKELARALASAADALELQSEEEVFQETDFYEAVKLYEISLIERALKSTGGNQARAARMLHLKQTTLHGKIKQYKIFQTVAVDHEANRRSPLDNR